MSDLLIKAYDNWDGFRAELPEDKRNQLDGMFKFSEDSETDRKRFLATQYISEKTGKPSEEVSNNLESYYLPAYSVAQDGFKAPAPLDLNAFHDRVRSEYVMEKEDRRASGEVTKSGMLSALTDEAWPIAWSKHRDANKMAGSPKEGEYLQRFIESRDAYAAKIEPYKGLAQSIVEESEKDTGAMAPTKGGDVAQGDSDMEGVAQKLLAVPVDQRKDVMEAAALLAESKGYDRKWLAQRMGENISRQTASLAEGLPRTLERNALINLQSLATKKGFGGFVGVPDSLETKEEVFNYLSNGLGYDQNLTKERQQGLRPLSEEERGHVISVASRGLELSEAQDQVSKFANETVDPTRYEDDNLVQKGLLGVASTIPSMAAAAVPYFGIAANAGMYANETYKEVRERNPDMSREDAHGISLVAAPVMAAIDKLELDVFVKGAPWMKDSLQGILGNTISRGVSRVVATNVTEMVGENVQDLTPYAVQHVASVLNDNIEGVEWHDVVNETLSWDKQGELLATTIILSAIGAGGGAIKDSAKVRSVISDPIALKAEGFSDEHISTITESAKSGDFGAAYRATQEAFKATDFKSPEVQARRKEASETVIARQQVAMNAAAIDQREAGVKAVTRDDQGWKIVHNDGQEFRVSSEKAAVSLVQDLGQTNQQLEADAYAQLVNQEHERGGMKRLTTASGELVKSDGESLTFMSNSGAIREDMNPKAITAIREEALMDARDSGNEAIDVQVNGFNDFPSIIAEGVSEVIQRIVVNRSDSMVNTFNHERVESAWRRNIAAGTMTHEETQQALFTVAPAFNPLKARTPELKAFYERIQRVAHGPINEVEMRETISELGTAEITGVMRDGSKVKVGQFSQALKAGIANAGDANQAKVLGKFYSFLVSMRSQFRAIFGTLATLNKARRDGTIKEGDDYHAFMEKLLGVDEQAKYDRGLAEDIAAQERLAELEDGGAAFSLDGNISPLKQANSFLRDKIAGEPLTTKDGLTATVSKTTANKMTSASAVHKSASLRSHLAAISDFKGLYESGIITESKPDREGNTNISVIHRVNSSMEHDGGQYDVKFTVKELTHQGNRIYSIEAIEIKSPSERKREDADAPKSLMSSPQTDGHGNNGISNAESQSFSLSPANQVSRAQELFDIHLAKSPAKRLKMQQEGKARLEKLGQDMTTDRMTPKGETIRAKVDPRTSASLDKEQAMREAMRGDELQQAVYAKYQGVLDTAEQAKLWSGPVMSELAVSGSRLKGRLMAKGVAAKAGKVDLFTQGDYDGMDGVPSVVFGGTVMPDVMAQELFDQGLIAEATPDALWNAIRQDVAQSQQWKEIIAKSKEETKRARDQAHEEAYEWRREQDELQKEDHSPRARLIRNARILDVALSVFPPDIRGKVSKFSTLVSKVKDETLMKDIEKRIEKAAGLLEKHLKGEIKKSVEKSLEKYSSIIGKKGSFEGKTTADITQTVDYVAAFSSLSVSEQDAEIALLEKTIADSNATQEAQALAVGKLGIAELFYDFDNQPSEASSRANDWLSEIIDKGRETKAILDENRKEYLESSKRSGVLSILGVEYSSAMDAENRQSEIKSSILWRTVEGVKGFINSVLPTSIQQLEDVFGEGSELANEFGDRLITAANLATDIKRDVEAKRKAMMARVFGTKNAIAQVVALTKLQEPKASGVMITEGRTTERVKIPVEMLERFSDGDVDAEALGLTPFEAELALEEWAEGVGTKRSVDVARVTFAGNEKEKTMSEMEAVNYLLHWNQSEVRKRMESHGWSEKSIKQLNVFLSPEAKEIARFINETYDKTGRKLVDPVYKRVFNAPLPLVKNFAPTFYQSQGADTTLSLEEGGGSGGILASFTKGRRSHNNNVRQMDAMTAFLSHFEHVSHWVSHIELMRDMKAIIGSRDIQDAVITHYGPSTSSALNKRLQYIETQGNDAAMALHDVNRIFKGLNQSIAFKALSFRISPIVKQTSALLNPLLADVPAHSYALGLARLMAGKVDVSAMWQSDIIQRRLEAGFSPEARIALSAQGSSPIGAAAVSLMQKGMMPMQYTDAGWTTIGAAVAFDYYRGNAIDAGMNEKLATASATKSVERMVARSAQPADLTHRSLIEASSNPFTKGMWMFASESRKTLAVEYYAIKKLATGKSKNRAMDIQRALVAHFAMAGVTQLMSGLMASAFGDDDKEEKEWSAGEWAAALIAGPINGLFVFGDALNYIGRAAFGLNAFSKATGVSKLAVDAFIAGKNIDDLFNGSDEEVMKEIDRLSGVLGQTLGSLIGPAAQSLDVVIGNTLRELDKVMGD